MYINSKLSITLIGGVKFNSLVSKETAQKILDQFYDVVSGELNDNCLEVETFDQIGQKETVLIRASEILFIQVKNE